MLDVGSLTTQKRDIGKMNLNTVKEGAERISAARFMKMLTLAQGTIASLAKLVRWCAYKESNP